MERAEAGTGRLELPMVGFASRPLQAGLDAHDCAASHHAAIARCADTEDRAVRNYLQGFCGRLQIILRDIRGGRGGAFSFWLLAGVVTRRNPAWNGEIADSFLFTHFHCAGLRGNYLQIGGRISGG